MYAKGIRTHTCLNEEIPMLVTKKFIIAKFLITYVNGNVHSADNDVIETITYELPAYETHR